MVAVPAGGEVGKPVILRLATAGADGDVPAGGAGEFKGPGGFGEGADLIDLEEQGVGGAGVHGTADAFGTGAEEVVAEDEASVAEPVEETGPVVPVVLGEAVFKADDGVPFGPSGEPVDHGGAVEGRAVEVVAAGVEEVGGGDIDRQGHVATGDEAGPADGFDSVVEHGPGGGEGGGETAFVGDEGAGVVAFGDQTGGGMKHGAGVSEGVRDRGGGDGEKEDVLDGDLTAGVFAAAEEVDGGAGQARGGDQGEEIGEMPVEGQAAFDGMGPGEGKGDAEDGIGAETFEGGGAVELEQGGVEVGLGIEGMVEQGFADFAGDVGGGLETAQAGVTLRVGVTQFPGLRSAGGGTGRDLGGGAGSADELAEHFEGGSSPAVEDLDGVEVGEGGHAVQRERRWSASRKAVATAAMVSGGAASSRTTARHWRALASGER